MKRTPTLELAGDDPETADPPPDGHVPPPLPPDDPEAWYAPDVRAQYELHPGVIATVREREENFEYDVREPALSPAGESALGRVEAHFSDANLARPLTREIGLQRFKSKERAIYAIAGFDPN